MSNILTIPASGSIYFDSGSAGSSTVPDLTGSAVSLSYDGNAGLNITSYNALSADRFSVDGGNGRLFSISDSLTGTIFSVNDAAGLPIIEVESDTVDTVTIGTYGTNALVVNDDKVGIGTNTPDEKLTVVGNISASGSLSANSANIIGDFSVDTDVLFADAVNNRVGIGTNSYNSTYKVHLFDAQLEYLRAFLVEYQVTGSSGISSPMTFKLTSTGNMVDGFGPGFLYAIQDSTSGEQFIARTCAYRSGADNTGAFRIDVMNAGSLDAVATFTANGNVGIGTTTPNEKLTVVGNISASGNIEVATADIPIITSDVIMNGTENTMPNQTLGGGDASVITRELMLRSEINYGWSIAPFSGASESPSSTLMSQTSDNLIGIMTMSSGALSGYAQRINLLNEYVNYPVGSGTNPRFVDSITMFFDYDTNYADKDIDTWWVYGMPNIFTAPDPSTHSCLAFVHRMNGSNPQTLEAIIYDGSGTPTSSGEIELPSTMDNLHYKQKFCVVWDGNTLSVYLANYLGYNYGNNPFIFNLIASVTHNSPPTQMSGNEFYFLRIATADLSGANITLFVSAPKFIRMAVHPL